MSGADYAIPPYTIPTLPVLGRTARFPVRRIYGVGRNYRAHAAETGLGGADGGVPGFSLKPTDSILADGGALPYPPGTHQLEPEIELVIAIGVSGADIAPGNALSHVFGYATGFDMIRRDIMQDCIANQHSWDMCKSFDGASPIGPISPAAEIGHPMRGAIWLDVNGERRQQGDIGELIWNAAEIIARLSTLSRLEPGDIIFTGTPKGPKPVDRGDKLLGHIDGLEQLALEIT